MTTINAKKYTELIGETPLIDLSGVINPKVEGVRLYGKAEFMNPGFSMKDRIVKHVLSTALALGDLRAGGTVVCASSGNTGASVAMLCPTMGLQAVIITSPKCSKEKMSAIAAYGATLIVEKDYMSKEIALAKENPDWMAFDQYNNALNPEAHYLGTGREVWEQTNGEVTHFVMSGSTGGTMSGCGRYLKEQNPAIRTLLADPKGSVFHTFHLKGVAGTPSQKWEVEGAGKETIPGCIDFSYIDDVVQVTDNEAFTMCQKLARQEGLLVGGSAGLNVHAAVELANSMDTPCTIVTILCDMGIKYLSKVYDNEWLSERNLVCLEAKL